MAQLSLDTLTVDQWDTMTVDEWDALAVGFEFDNATLLAIADAVWERSQRGLTEPVEAVLTTATKEEVASAVGSATAGSGSEAIVVTVQDGAGVVVSGATVNVRGSAGESLGIYGTTNALGKTTFNLDPGDYQLAVTSRSGFAAHTPEPLTVTTAGSVTVTVSRTLAADYPAASKGM